MHDTFKKFDLTGRTAFVTGGGTGIGYFMSRGLAALGARVMIAARRADVLAAAANQLREETGREVLYAPIDLADRSNTIAAARSAVERLGGVDIFVGNAGQDSWAPIDRVRDEDVDRLMLVNVTANITLAREFIPHMRKKKWGRILLSSSITERLVSAQEGMTAYAASKAAVSSLARSIAVDTGHDGITANAIVFGAFMTDMLQASLDSVGAEQRAHLVNAVVSQNALGRFAQPHEAEGVVQLLASDAGSYITGAAIPVEAGWTVTLKANPAADPGDRP
ncbi:MAG TPA: SDR family NAD(P)-dependent oxidoreductase [Nevskiaceae bacterium]|nr:SDR family NAD(P)-dependent oxidoreductase [Nevskiaceae bacterium]